MSVLSSYWRAVRALPRSFALIVWLKVLESACYFMTALNLSVYLTSAHALTDTQAGLVYALWGVALSVASVVCGPLIDRMGLATSVWSGALLSLVGRALLALAVTRTQVYVALFVFQTAGIALGIPVLTIAVRRLAHEPNTRSLLYGCFYAAMNVGALAAGTLTDLCVSVHGDAARAMTSIWWLCTALSCAYLLTALFLSAPFFEHVFAVRLAAVPPHNDDDVEAEGDSPATTKRGAVRSIVASREFWCVVCVSACMFGSRSVFRHIDATLPKWLVRTLGPRAHYGLVYALNPLLIIGGVPAMQALLGAMHADTYGCFVTGTSIVALAPLALAVLTPSYGAALLFVCVLTLGEAIYSPRLTEFALTLSPPGREGVFGALATVPLFGVKLVSGLVGGQLLDAYCRVEEDGATPSSTAHLASCQRLWFVVCGMGATTPTLLMLVHSCVYTRDIARRLRVDNNDAVPLTPHTTTSVDRHRC